MKTILTTITVVLIALSVTYGQSSIKVRHVEGDCFTVHVDGDKEKYSKIVIAPLKEAKEIIVKKGATLSLINTNNEVVDITTEGRYMVSDLSFSVPEDKTIMDKFYNYFHSFFSSHASSESKVSYQNSIYAISRGDQTMPYLDFPLDGELPYTSGSMIFSWTHACDDCQYVFSINEYSSRSAVYATTTKDKSYTLAEASKYLQARKKYYWTVAISGLEMEYDSKVFTMSDKDQYAKILSGITSSIKTTTMSSNTITSTIFVMSELLAQGKQNYAIYYGMKQVDSYPADTLLRDYVERFWYDALMN